MWKVGKRKKLLEGFTLIELLVSVGLIAVLTVGVINLLGQSSRRVSRDARRQADLQKISAAMELYRNDIGFYPNTNCYNSAGACPAAQRLSLYVTPLPTDPQAPAQVYTYTPGGACGTGACTYTLCAIREQPQPNTPCGIQVNNP